MIEIAINRRSKTSTAPIWALEYIRAIAPASELLYECKGTGPYYHSTSYLDCAGRANLGHWRSI